MRKTFRKLGHYIYGLILAIILVTVIHVVAGAKIDSSSISVDTTNISNLSADATLKDALDALYVKAEARESMGCPSYYYCQKLKSTPEVGDYIKMTPTLKSFTTDKTKTGYSLSQTINPSNLNLWRVIKVNNDGTIEIVSDKPSSEEIDFYGKVGYMNYIGYLNVLASKYENSKYTVGSRHMGYSNQTEYITDNSKITQTTAPWSCSTGASCHPENQENLGGGDLGYVNDINLVQNVYGTLKSAYPYFVASRYYDYSYGSFGFSVRYVETNLSTDDATYSNNKSDTYFYQHIRPILILKSDIAYTPSTGTIAGPFILN